MKVLHNRNLLATWSKRAMSNVGEGKGMCLKRATSKFQYTSNLTLTPILEVKFGALMRFKCTRFSNRLFYPDDQYRPKKYLVISRSI